MKIFQVSWVFVVLVFIGNILIMNKSQRIYLSSGDTGNDTEDKYIRVKLEQDTETLEFMSLKIGTTDVYQNFNADYGVLVGRVIANGGIGVENAKISIFIPVDDEDATDPEIYSVYPYKTPRDTNNKKTQKQDNFTPNRHSGVFRLKKRLWRIHHFLMHIKNIINILH